MSVRPLPPTFMFGCGHSDSQCEAFEKDFADIRDLWYERRHLQERGRATDFWNRYEEDVKLARDLGCQMFRFSIAWARVEPRVGAFSQTAIDHYAKVVDSIVAAGMEPFVTLCHFTWPVHLEERGGLLADAFPSAFAAYATQMAERFGPKVRFWGTINEPNILSFGYIKPWWERNYFGPPGLPADAKFDEQNAALIRMMRNVFLAHKAGRDAIKAINPNAMVGANPANLGLPIWAQRFLDRKVINMRTPEDAAKQGRGFAERQHLENGKVDVVVATFTKTPERASQLEFAEVYFVASQRALVLAGSAVTTTAGLAGQKIAAVTTSTAEDTVRTRFSQSKLTSAKDHLEAVRILDAGEVAAFVADDVKLISIMKASPGRYRLLPERFTEEPYAPAITKGNPRLLVEVDLAVHDFIGTGQWAESYARHIGGPVPELPQLPTLANVSDVGSAARKRLPVLAAATPEATPASDMLDAIRTRGRIVIGVKDDVPGFGVVDPDTGERAGLEIDIARAIARRIFGDDKKVEFVSVATKERIPFLRTLLRFLDPLFKWLGLITTSATTAWWHLGMEGKLPKFLCPPECVGQLDFVGFDYYWGMSSLRLTRILGLLDALAAGRMEKAPVFARGLYRWLNELGSKFPKLPIIIVENGCVERADGVDRRTYLEQHIREVQRAVGDGVNVLAYLCWSITSNRELGHRFRPDTDFGLHHIELDTDPKLVRTATPAALRYREIIQRRSVDSP